jgi:hypothetical protein
VLFLAAGVAYMLVLAVEAALIICGLAVAIVVVLFRVYRDLFERSIPAAVGLTGLSLLTLLSLAAG